MNPPVELTLQPQIQVEDDRTGISIITLRRAIADNLFYVQGKFPIVLIIHSVISCSN